MSNDKAQIRDLVARWQAATSTGDSAAILELMTDDVVFLVPGRPPMSKDEFAALSSPPAGALRPKIEPSQRIREIEVVGEVAYMWSELCVSVTPPGASQPIEREGHALSIFRKRNGTWLLARDANLLVPKRREA